MTAHSGPQGFTAQHPCEVCGGWEALPRGQGVRCRGFISSDGDWIHCSREEHAGRLEAAHGGTFGHRRFGPCRCGSEHGAAVVSLNGAGQRNGVNGHKAPPSTNGQRPDWWCPGLPEGAEWTTTYVYRDESARPQFEVLRYQLRDGGKTFRQRHQGASGKVEWHAPERLRRLYRLPELIAADAANPVFILEGERDVESLLAIGLVATTNPLGAGRGKWLPQYSETLRDRRVVLIPDNDPQGREHMAYVEASLRGKATQVRLLTLPDIGPKGDVSDWLAAGGTAEQLISLVEQAKILWPPPDTKPKATSEPRRLVDLQREGLSPIQWVIDQILPEGVTICAGAPKQGKSFLVLELAIAVATGVPALGDLAVTHGEVLYLSLEGGPHGLLPRVNTMLGGAEVSPHLFFATEWPRLDDGGAEALDRWLSQHSDAQLVIVDTLQRVRGKGSGGKRGIYEEDYEALRPLIDLALKYRVAIVLVHHTNKSSADDVFQTISGSFGLIGAVDAGWVLQRVRGEKTAVLGVAGRNIPDLQLGLEWDDLTLTWKHVGNGTDARRSSERREILRILESNGGGPLTVQEVVDSMEGKPEYDSIRKTLWRMQQSGELRKKGNNSYEVPLQ